MLHKLPTPYKVRRLLPVIGFDEIVLHEHLIHSHHQHSIDIILHPYTGTQGELCWLVLINTQIVYDNALDIMQFFHC